MRSEQLSATVDNILDTLSSPMGSATAEARRSEKMNTTIFKRGNITVATRTMTAV